MLAGNLYGAIVDLNRKEVMAFTQGIQLDTKAVAKNIAAVLEGETPVHDENGVLYVDEGWSLNLIIRNNWKEPKENHQS